MKDSNQRWMPYIAAALLASLTIRVFFELQDYGPESAIREFYASTPAAIQTRNFAQLEGYNVDTLKGPNEVAMIRLLALWRSNGVSMQIGRVERTDNEVRAVVIFTFAKGTIWASVWVVQRTKKMWRADARYVWSVDVNKTATIFRDSRPPALSQ